MNRKVKHIDKNIVDVTKARPASSKAVRDFRTRLSKVGNSPLAYELELLKGFAKSNVKGAYVFPLLIIAITVISIQWVPIAMSFPWAASAIAVHGAMTFLSKRFLASEAGQNELDNWRRKMLTGQVAVAAVWIAFVSVSCSNCGTNGYSTLQFASILALNASLAIMSYSLGRIVLIMATPATLILAGRFIVSQDISLWIMAGILLSSIAFFYFATERFRNSLLEVLEHSTEKETLIVELETEKAMSEEARKRAEEANMAKSRFLATMSHELRTPLNAILGFSEMMRDEILGPVENEQYREYVNDIHNSGSHLLKLINEILDISRIEAGRHELKEEKVSLIDIVEDARTMMAVKAKQKNVSIQTSYQENLETIWVDEQAMRQIVLNLLSNALKFTPSGGTVTLKVGWTSRGGQYISVKDTGPGIPEEEIPVVLSSFGQGSIAIHDAEQGTGLGLSIVQGLLHVHQGKFSLKSELRKGTEAIAYLPKDRVTVMRPTAKKAQVKSLVA